MIAFATKIVFVEKSLVSFFVNMYILCIYILGWGGYNVFKRTFRKQDKPE